MQTETINPGFLDMVRRRIRSGEERRTGYVYKDAADPRLRLRLSAKSITLVAAIFVPAAGERGQMRYFTLDRIAVRSDSRITEKLVRDARDKITQLAILRENETAGRFKDDQAAKHARALTCRQLYDLWLAEPGLADDLRSLPHMKPLIEKNFLNRPLPAAGRPLGCKAFGDVPPSFFSQAESREWIETIERECGPNTARLTRAYTQSMFSRLIKRRIIDAGNSLTAPPPVKKSEERHVILSASQIRHIWDATEVLPEHQRDFVRVLMLTARRRQEVSGLQFDWIDYDNRVIRFPVAIMKNKAGYEMPLTDYVAEILKKRPVINGSPYAFATSNGSPMTQNFSKILARLDCAITGQPYTKEEFNAAGQKWRAITSREHAPFDWVFHDFRSSAVSLITKADTSVTVDHCQLMLAQKLIAKGRAIGHYHSGDNLGQKRHVMELLTAEIRKIADPNFRDTKEDTFKAELAALLARHGKQAIDISSVH